MLKYKVSDTTYWPNKTEIDLPKKQDMLPMFDESTPAWKRYLTFGQLRRKYITEEDYVTYLPNLDKYCVIRSLFIHDWASIPGPLRIFTSPDGVLAYGALPHDEGYRHGGLFLADTIGDEFVFTALPRKTIDEIFRSRNDKANKLKAINTIVHGILRTCGSINFKDIDPTTVDWDKPH